MAARNSQHGFTLVEIAIVMVIVGLLLGGALKGQEMIENARVKSILRFETEFRAAWFSYQDIYRAFPGDDRRANRFDEVANNQVGNGNGIVNGHWRGPDNQETVLVWLHLQAANLLPAFPQASNAQLPGGANNSAIPRPTHVFGGVIGFENNPDEVGRPILCFGNIDDTVGRKIDIAADDGNPRTGRVFASNIGAATRHQMDNYDPNGTLCFDF